MQYTLSLNARMLTLAGLCLLSLFILLFLLGVEMGKKMAVPDTKAASALTSVSPADAVKDLEDTLRLGAILHRTAVEASPLIPLEPMQ